MDETRKQAPLAGLTFIAWFYMFGALVLIAAVLNGSDAAARQIANVHGVPALAGTPIMIGVSALAFVLAFGLLRFTVWGYWLTVIYLLYLLLCVPAIVGCEASNFGNLVWPIAVLVYLRVRKRQYFTRAAEKGTA